MGNLNKVTCMILFLSIFLINFASASIYYEENNQTYEIDTWVPTWLGGDGYSNVTLVSNTDQCLVDCGFHLSGYNEEEVSLIEEIEFLDKSGNDASEKLQDLTFQLGTYQLVEKYNETYETVCENITNENGTISQECSRNLLSNETYEDLELIWQDYAGEQVSGYWEIKASASKLPTSSMDWIITFRGKELTEWAWWDNDWNYKRQINISENSGSTLNNYSVLLYINYSKDTGSKANSDFSDLRFLNSTETGELGYWIENKSDGNYAWVWIKLPELVSSTNTSIYMYYGNSGSSSNSDESDAFLFYEGFEYSDSVTNHGWTLGYGNIPVTTTAQAYSGSRSATTSSSSGFSTMNKASSLSFGNSIMNVKILARTGSYHKTIMRYAVHNDPFYLAVDVAYDPNFVKRIIASETSSSQTISGSWQDFTFVYDGTNYNLYIDGISQGSGAGSSPNDLQFGDYWGGNSGEKMWIDDITIRAYASVVPTYLIGSEEINGGTIDIDYITPPTPVNYANITNETFTVEVQVNYTNATFQNITYRMENINGTNYTTTFTNETYSLNYTIPTGHYHYYVEVCGTDDIILDIICESTATRHLLHDTSPPVFNGTSPMGTYDYLYENKTLDVNWTVVDEGAGLDSCWFYYNGERIDVNCTDNHSQIYYAPNVDTLTGYANDTLGNEINVTLTWDYLILDLGETYDSTVTEATPNTISRILRIPDDSVSSIVLDYNGTNYTTTLGYSGGNYSISSTVVAPSVDADSNITLSHYVTIGSSTYQTYESTQTIQALNFSVCSGGDVILNLSLFDEEDKTELNGTIEVNAMLMSVLSGEEVESVLLDEVGVQNVQICLDPISSIDNFYLDADIRYYADDYATEFYFIKDADLDDYPIYVPLYDLSLNSSTEFLLRYRGETLTEIEGAIIQLLRYYTSDGGYETVEAPETSISGTAVAHIDLNTNKYKAIVVKDGEILDIFDNVVFDCENELSGQCEQNLYADIDAYNVISSDSLNDFSYVVSDTGSSLITTFSIPSGSSSSVNVLVTQTDQFGNKTNCNQTITTSSGSLECEYSDSIGDSYVTLEVSKDGDQQFQEEYYISDSDEVEWGGLNWLAMFVLLISLAMMAISSPEWIIGNAIITFIIGGSLWLVAGTNIVVGLGLLIWLVIAAIILILELAKQEDR